MSFLTCSLRNQNGDLEDCQASTKRFQQDKPWMISTNQIFYPPPISQNQPVQCHGCPTITVCKFRHSKTLGAGLPEVGYGVSRARFDQKTGIWFGGDIQEEETWGDGKGAVGKYYQGRAEWQPWMTTHQKHFESPKVSPISLLGCHGANILLIRQLLPCIGNFWIPCTLHRGNASPGLSCVHVLEKKNLVQ